MHTTYSKSQKRSLGKVWKKVFLTADISFWLLRAVKKSFFQILTRLCFWLIECFLCILYTCYAYEKCLLESKQTIRITCSTIIHVQMVLWQEKCIFTDFKKIILWSSQNPMLAVEKGFFQTLMRFHFQLVDCVVWIFEVRYACKKCFLGPSKLLM